MEGLRDQTRDELEAQKSSNPVKVTLARAYHHGTKIIYVNRLGNPSKATVLYSLAYYGNSLYYVIKNTRGNVMKVKESLVHPDIPKGSPWKEDPTFTVDGMEKGNLILKKDGEIFVEPFI